MDLLLGIMIALILSLIPITLLLRDQIEKRWKTGKRVKLLLIIYRSIYGLCVGLFLLAATREILSYFDKKERDRNQSAFQKADTSMFSHHDRKMDSGFMGVDTSIQGLSKQIDTNFRKFAEPKSIAEKPQLILSPGGSANPAFSFEDDSLWRFVILVQTTDKELAYNIKDRHFLLGQWKGELYLVRATNYKNGGNESTRIGPYPVKLTYWAHYPVEKNTQYIIPDTMYNFEKIEYANKDGISQPPFIGMYRVDPKFKNESLPEANRDEFEKVKQFLIRENKW
jgi:hypothetical protein